MNKYLKWAALPLILIFTLGATVEPGLKIWQYPNRPVPSDTAFFVLSEGGVTYNVSAFQLRSKITNGLATVNYVITTITNTVFVAPGSTNVGIVTNRSGSTVTYTIYATNDGSGGGGSSAISGVWSNGVNVATPATNINTLFNSDAGIILSNGVAGRVDWIFRTVSIDLLTTTSNALWTLTTTAGTNYMQSVSNQLYTNLLAQLNTASNFLATNFLTRTTNSVFVDAGTANVTIATNTTGGKTTFTISVASSSPSNFTSITVTNLLEVRETVAYSGTNCFLNFNYNAGVLTLTNDCLIIVTNWPASAPITMTYNLDLVQGSAGSYRVFWDSHVKWPLGVTPTITTAVGSVDVISLRVSHQQTNFNAVYQQDFR